MQDQAYADVNLSGQELEVFNEVVEVLLRKVRKPTVVVHLICPVEAQLRRIADRRRNEERSITATYLQALNQAIEQRIPMFGVPTLVVNSGARDFATDARCQAEVANEVVTFLNSHSAPTKL
ncbi:MAG: hypothetical protein FJX65_13875 [Alphaproteobacteria bacterium]|nr:hypothetical protein [Alphaproteobacteria bacterium]